MKITKSFFVNTYDTGKNHSFSVVLFFIVECDTIYLLYDYDVTFELKYFDNISVGFSKV
ncbi:hypothetical protein [Thermosipho melanesiensis]|uniref:Uncharacterized protein n=1 Tax=Thermosipho melanesiensis (strain DSM 12029 / CIP 104789 / BI429) TaxID=391009 RepID=A6LLZ1_THEM4|nr:hypothetical protein [Thermosipho melanesiensis]ABR30942.1 hypothetical protein Tmel_1082 [Thermosipho melanesiensis BI429]